MRVQDTSLEAYVVEQPLIISQIEKMRGFFNRYPTISFTDADLAQVFHWKANVVWSRRSQLVRDGYIVASGFEVNEETGHRVTAYKCKTVPGRSRAK